MSERVFERANQRDGSWSTPGTPPVVVGPDSIERIADVAVGAGPAVLVVDAAVVTTGYCDRVGDVLKDHADVIIHVVPQHEPTSSSVDAAADVVRHTGSTIVVGIGGGTALDTAKQAAAVAAGAEGVDHYALGAHRLPAGPPVVAIPTTAGTGAEVTRTCIVTDAAGRKVWTWGDELLPALVVLDPVATVTMPAHVTAATGLDAFVHAVEAVTGRRSNSLVASPALQAIRLVLDHLADAVGAGDDLDVRQGMQEAALLAGLAIDGGGTGIAHSIGHALGTLGHVPHGVAVAVGLAAALAWNVEGAPEAYEPIAVALGCRPAELVDIYAGLLEAVGFAAAVDRVGDLRISASGLAEWMVAPENQPMYFNNCRLADDTDRFGLAEATFRTWEDLRSTS